MQALTSKLQKARNFSATAFVLLQSFLKLTGWRGLATLIGAAAIGSFQPIPLAFLAHIATKASQGTEATIAFHNVSFSLQTAFYVAIAFVLFEVIVTHVMDRLMLAQNTLWQDRMFKNLLDGAPRAARPYFAVTYTGANLGREYAQLIIRAVTSASLFGRLIARALRDATSAIVALGILTWLDISTLALIAFVSCLLLPFFGRAASVSAHSRLVNQKRARAVHAAAGEWAEKNGLEQEAETPSDRYRPLYTLPNQTKLQLSKFRFLSGLNVVAVLLAFFVWNGGDVQTLLHTKLVYLAILVLFLRSVRNLSGSVAAFSQQYTALATLKSFLAPRPKSLKFTATALSGSYIVTDRSGKTLTVKPEDPVYILMPPTRLGFQLVGLSNALMPCAPASNPEAVWLSHYQAGTDAAKAEPASGGLVVSEADWPEAERAGYGKGQCIFIAVSSQSDGIQRVPSRSIIVSDGEDILEVGTYAACYDRYAKQLAAGNLRPKQRVIEDETEEDE